MFLYFIFLHVFIYIFLYSYIFSCAEKFLSMRAKIEEKVRLHVKLIIINYNNNIYIYKYIVIFKKLYVMQKLTH